MISIFFMFLYGIGTGLAMLAAQYYGKGDCRAFAPGTEKMIKKFYEKK